MLPAINRRSFCQSVAGTFAAGLVSVSSAELDRKAVDGLSLGIGNYGMKSLSVEDAIRLIDETGFDGLELSVMPEWDSAPAKLNFERRRSIRQLLADRELRLESLMEDLTPSADLSIHQMSLDRLKLATELGHDLSPQNPPLVQTVLGGGTWDEKKNLFRDRLGDWSQVAETQKAIIAIKPHRSGAMSQPSQAAWLLEQLGHPRWMGMVYDYSHYAFRDLSISSTIESAFPTTVQIVVKDIIRRGQQFEFSLPGESGTIDYQEILKDFYNRGYRQSVICEVSSQVFRQPGYDVAAATKACYASMNRVFEKSLIPRHKSTSAVKSLKP